MTSSPLPSDNSVLINDLPRPFTSLRHNAFESSIGGSCFLVDNVQPRAGGNLPCHPAQAQPHKSPPKGLPWKSSG